MYETFSSFITEKDFVQVLSCQNIWISNQGVYRSFLVPIPSMQNFSRIISLPEEVIGIFLLE